MRQLRDISILVGLALLAGACATPEPTTYDLYFLGGQSNMEGFGFSDELPAGFAAQSRDVLIFTGQMALDNETHGGEGIWRRLEPGFGTGFRTDGETSQLSDRFGPELFFGLTMAEMGPNKKIAIVKYALGGSGLADGIGYGNWQPDFSTGAGINQYDHALKTLRGALAHTDIDGDGTPTSWSPPESSGCRAKPMPTTASLLRAAMRVSVMDFIKTVQRAQRRFHSARHGIRRSND